MCRASVTHLPLLTSPYLGALGALGAFFYVSVRSGLSASAVHKGCRSSSSISLTKLRHTHAPVSSRPLPAAQPRIPTHNWRDETMLHAVRAGDGARRTQTRSAAALPLGERSLTGFYIVLQSLLILCIALPTACVAMAAAIRTVHPPVHCSTACTSARQGPNPGA